MSTRQSADEPTGRDAEVLESIANHGMNRRTLMRVLGAGTAVSLGAGKAVADHDDPHPPHIDSHYGYATPDAEDVPKKLEPDHEVELHVIPPKEEQNQPGIFHFEPSGLCVDCGDIVQFTFTAPDHTVTAYHPAHGFQQRVPDGVPPFSSPVVNVGGAWLYRFETEGLYDMYCAPHHILGMAMRIVVGDLDEVPNYENTFEGSEGPPPLLAPFSKEFLEHELNDFPSFIDADTQDCEWAWLTPVEVLSTPALDPDNICDDGTVSFDDVLEDIERADLTHEHE